MVFGGVADEERHDRVLALRGSRSRARTRPSRNCAVMRAQVGEQPAAVGAVEDLDRRLRRRRFGRGDRVRVDVGRRRLAQEVDQAARRR